MDGLVPCACAACVLCLPITTWREADAEQEESHRTVDRDSVPCWHQTPFTNGHNKICPVSPLPSGGRPIRLRSCWYLSRPTRSLSPPPFFGSQAMAVVILPVARPRTSLLAVSLVAVALHALARGSDAQLSAGFYSASCPTLNAVVRQVMSQAVVNDTRSGPGILRLFFHDCFVSGCDASLLLDDTATTPGEKGAGPNAGGSMFGFDVIDSIKTQVEAACPGVVSCADILALAARDTVNLLGGPSWAVPLGRRDATVPNPKGAATDLPGPDSDLAGLVSAFAAKGLTSRDLAALSGAHTVGMARCVHFRTHVYCDANVSPSFASEQRQACPSSGGDASLAPLDSVTPNEFDNGYYRGLMTGAGLMRSDQELFNNGQVDSLVRLYGTNPAAFSADFAASMIRLGNIGPLTAASGEIRLDCRKVNS
uniref:Uncharacterized protein n=1 Tax=Avena sativa TaxID=4498 RepID=A0ACD5Z018_AVESA